MKALLIVLLATFGLSTAAQAKSKSGELLAGLIIGAAIQHNLDDDHDDYSVSHHDDYYDDEDDYYYDRDDRYDRDRRDRRRRRAERERRRRQRERERDRRRRDRDRDRDHDDRQQQCSNSQSVQLLCEVKEYGRKEIKAVSGEVACSGYGGDTCYNVDFYNHYVKKLNVTFKCKGGEWKLQHRKNNNCVLEK